MPARYLMTLIVPLIVMALAIPLILQKVPRNALYGFRTPLTMSSDKIWYPANKILGIALLAAGAFWLAFANFLPGMMDDQRRADRLIGWFGGAAVLGACAISYWLTYRKYRS
jgi:hypothetical protein